MYITTYDPIAGTPIGTQSLLSFGDAIQKQHCSNPIVFRTFPDSETNISNMKLFLESRDGWSVQCGYFTSPTFVSGVKSGDSNLSSHFVETPGATPTSPNGILISVTDSVSDFVWLDIDLPDTQTGVAEINYRFTFDHD